MTEPVQSELLTPEEAAIILRASVGTLAVWRSTKRYPVLAEPVEKGGAVVRRGRKVFYLAAVVREFASKSQSIG